MKSNAAVVTAGIITFGRQAQDVFNRLPKETQDRAFTELAREIAAQLKTELEALVVHLDESAIHAHFTMRANNDDGEPLSNATRLGDMGALQDLAAEVMQRYAPEIERGNKKKARLEAGANYADTLHRTVKQLHADLETKKELTEKEVKRQETYSRRLEKRQAEMATEMEALEARRSALETAMTQDSENIEKERDAVRAERKKVQEQSVAARRAKESYEQGVNAIEAVLFEAENETLSYNPDSSRTTMQDPTPVKNTPPNLRTQIVKLAKRLAFVESNLFTRIFRLDAQIDRIWTFIARTDIAPDARQEAKAIVRDVAEDEPDLG